MLQQVRQVPGCLAGNNRQGAEPSSCFSVPCGTCWSKSCRGGEDSEWSPEMSPLAAGACRLVGLAPRSPATGLENEREESSCGLACPRGTKTRDPRAQEVHPRRTRAQRFPLGSPLLVSRALPHINGQEQNRFCFDMCPMPKDYGLALPEPSSCLFLHRVSKPA